MERTPSQCLVSASRWCSIPFHFWVLPISAICSLIIWFTCLQFTFGDLSVLLVHCLRYFIPQGYDWKIWSNFRAISQDSEAKGQRISGGWPHLLKTVICSKTTLDPCSFSSTLGGSENILLFLCTSPEVSEEWRIVVLLSPTCFRKIWLRNFLVDKMQEFLA